MSAATLNATFSALADPTRRAILARLGRGEMSVKELIRPFRLSAPAMTKHLKVLERTGLVRRSRRAQWRPCRLNAAPLAEVVEWIAPYRLYWESSFDRLDAHLREVQPGFDPRPVSNPKLKSKPKAKP